MNMNDTAHDMLIEAEPSMWPDVARYTGTLVAIIIVGFAARYMVWGLIPHPETVAAFAVCVMIGLTGTYVSLRPHH
jgi:hypothetical protein